MEPTGRFSCSDPLINRLQENIVWSQKGNFLDIPSDCPQRDERLGWTGDTQIFCPTASFNFNIAPFFTKWLSDLKADQSANGAVPDVIPDVTTGGGSAGWGDAAVIVPWTLYLHYNDKQILEQQYPSMKAWVEYMRNRAGNDYIWSGDPQFGDWQELVPSFVDDPRFVTNKDFIATAYYFHTTGILAKIAAILGKTEEAEEYSTLAEKIKRMFQMNFVAPGGKLNSNTQTAYLLALAFDLLSEKQARQAASYLASYLESVGHLTTGFIGTPLLCPTLSKIGRADLAFKLLLRKEFPSWLFPITRGATTIWERWDGIRPDGTFQDASMNSLNHYVYGSIGQWLYQYVAGLNPDELHPGYRHIVLKPHPGPGLSWAKADYQSMYGSITSAWRIEKGKMFIQTQIPANTTAELILPVERTTEISVNGKKISLEPGTGIDLGSGSYQVEFDYYLN
jgi:alpha-L-rhamnosidase